MSQDVNASALAAFIGHWSGVEVMHPTAWTPAGGERRASVINRSALDGLAVIQDYEQRDGETVTYTGHAVLMAQGGGYALHWFDRYAPSLFTGRNDGPDWVFESKSAMGHTRATYRFDGGAYVYRMDMTHDGDTWTPLVDGSYTRI